MILIAPVLKIPESFKWRARLSNQLRTLLHSIFFLNIGRPEDILNVLTASRRGIMIVWEKNLIASSKDDLSYLIIIRLA